MSSIFDNEDDSEEDRVEARRQKLRTIQSEKADVEEPNLESSPDNSEDEHCFSEEKELEKMRKNAIYIKYKASAKRRRSSPSESAKKQRTGSSDEGEDVHEKYGQRDVKGESGHDGLPDPEPNIVIPSGLPKSSGEKAMLQQSVQVHSSALNSTKLSEKRTRDSKIDPKIIGDSSDGSSGSEESEDEENIGPILPPPRMTTKKRGRNPKLDPKIIDDSSDEDSSNAESDDESNIGPVPPPNPARDATDNAKLLNELPIQNEVTLGSTHDSFVSCLTIDKKGSRLVSGSIDSTIKLWDFNTMTRSLQTSKTQSPLDDSPLRCVKFSATGGALLCSGGASTAAILDRDGYIVSQTVRGDMYIVDMARTKGHIGAIHTSCWKPSGNSASRIFLTTSADATIRLWDVTRTTKVPMVDYPVISQIRVTKVRNGRGAKAVATAAEWTPDGKSVVLGCSDGRVKIVDPESYSIRPVAESAEVLRSGAEATSISVSPPSSPPLILVRSTDDCLRVLDQRMLTSTLAEFGDLPNAVMETNATFVGSTGEYFVTGTSANRKGGTLRGSIRLFERGTMKEVWKSEMEEASGSVICTLWHPVINQIVYGTGDGRIHVLYNGTRSHRGVLNCVEKSEYRKAHGMASVGVGEIFTPYSLHKRNAGEGGKTAEGVSNRGRKEVARALKPKEYTGPEDLRPGSSTTLAKYLSKGAITEDWSRDPREALHKYAEEAKKKAVFTSAYEKTQPVTLLASKTAEQEEEESRQAIFERDRLRKQKG